MIDRRRLLGLLPAGLVLSATPSATLPAPPRPRRAALLLPLSGPSASLGLSMQRAAAMAQPLDGRDAGLVVVDTAGTAAGAAAAAARAVKAGAGLILGPLLTAEVRPVVAAVAGRAPVLTFSNDEGLRDGGAFLLGITASQCCAAILAYARRRGVRRVALLQAGGPWAAQVGAAARRVADDQGIALTATADLAALRRAADPPDAVLVADGGEAFGAAARALQGSGIQLLGTHQASGAPVAADGAWLAAPDPQGFGDFARAFEAQNGGQPGGIAALAYDGAGIVRALRAAGRLDRAGLVQTASFPAVTGALHFREDGSASRALAILIATPAGTEVAPA